MDDLDEDIADSQSQPAVNWQARLLCLALGLFVGTLLTALLLTANRRLQPTPIVIEPPPPRPTATPLPTATATRTPAPLAVYVSGAVAASGVYELPAGSRLEAAIAAAGGFQTEAATEQLNLAQPLQDGDQVHVPFQEEVVESPPIIQTAAPVVAAEPAGGAAAPGRININSADAALLETLPGIGPATAQQIIGFRDTNGPFATTEAIMEVPGIGPAKFAAIADLITVGE